MVKAVRRRTEPPEVRRAQILDAAKSRFRKVGFHETTVAEIAELAGVSVGLVYQYFPGKEALIAAIVTEDDAVADARIRAGPRCEPRECSGCHRTSGEKPADHDPR